MTALSHLRGLRVGLWGVGAETLSLARRLHGAADLVAVDDDPATAASRLPDGVRVRRHPSGLIGCDVVVAAPAIPGVHPWRRKLAWTGATVCGTVGLWLADAPADRVLLVTGTKGKSTTAHLTAHLLRRVAAAAGHDLHVWVGGNLGTPVTDAPDDADVYVVEVSSYQAAAIRTAAGHVAITSLGSDHLPWHGGQRQYLADKLSICPAAGAVIAPAAADVEAHRHLLGGRVTWVAPDAASGWAPATGLRGEHNVRNAAVAAAAAAALLDIAGVAPPDGDAGWEDAACDLPALPGRLATVHHCTSVEAVDDSLATTPHAAVAALDAFHGRPVALLAGGLDRGVDMTPLLAALQDRTAPTALLPLPTTGTTLARQVQACAPAVHVAAVPDVGGRPALQALVAAGVEWLDGNGGGVLLLSPAAASHDHFAGHSDRSAAFLDAITGTCRSPADAE